MTIAPPKMESQLQHERMARAQVALMRGEMQVMSMTDITWIVASKSNRYTVSLDGDAWTCTCPDFTGRCQRFGLRCKHIEAVRLSEAETTTETWLVNQYTNPQLSTIQTEEPMNKTIPKSDPPMQGSVVEQILWRLMQPLDMNRVKRRQSAGQGTVPYLEGYDVIEVANDLFTFHWSFDLLSEPHIMRWDRVITFYDQRAKKKVPVLGEDGKPTMEIAGVAYITGRIIVELDGKTYSHADAGRCIFNGDSPDALDMAIAGAVTDCLKRCFRQLGEQFGNSLYDKEIARTAGMENGNSNGHGSNGNGRSERSNGQAAQNNSTSSQLVGLQYQDGVTVDTTNAAELEAFNAFRSANHEQYPASREALRAWITTHNGKK
jgi:predicted nucleic acid-binding Zn finger protein